MVTFEILIKIYNKKIITILVIDIYCKSFSFNFFMSNGFKKVVFVANNTVHIDCTDLYSIEHILISVRE